MREKGYKELKKLKQVAISSQNYLMQYLITRQELKYISDLNFTSYSEKNIVEMQMNARAY